MSQVLLRGQLVCASDEQVALVAALLPRHLELTRAEPGCLSFEVERTPDPYIWSVAETFCDAEAFAAHQTRTAASEWGTATLGIERRYAVGDA